MNNKKFCVKCLKDKFLDEFGKSKRSRDGRKNICLSCPGGTNKTRTKSNGERLALKSSHESKLFSHEVVRTRSKYVTVKCHKCGKHFQPTLREVYSRYYAMNSTSKGESNFYCSDNCRNTCSTYRQTHTQKDHPLRRISVRCNQHTNKYALLGYQIDKHGYTFCEKCGTKTDKLSIHHNLKVINHPERADDISHQLLVCKKCHTHEGC